jgi:carotenoid cleavage dioxygenase
MHRWRIDLRAGGVRSTPLDDIVTEFPRVDPRRAGLRHRFGYTAAREAGLENDARPEWTAIRKYDLERRTMETRSYGAGNGVGEPLFVPRAPDAAEDDGWVLALVYDQARNASRFDVLDARNIAGEPVATAWLPHRVPYGFHGNWVGA